MIRTKKKKTHIYLLVLLLLLGIGFALLTATLKINGTINIDSASWDVHFENVQVTQGSVTATTVPTSDDATTTEMAYAVSFTQPGDFYEFTTDIANDGTINAMVNLVTNKTYQADGETEKQLPAYLKSTVTYNDGTPINKNHLLAKQTSEKIKVRVEFKTDVNPEDLPSSAETTVFKFSSTFKQADENACPKTTTFANDSWDTIQCNVKQNPSSYPLGATKTISMDLDGDNTDETYTLRVANNTIPSECSTQGFSQSACGFVVEFVDVIAIHNMNPSGEYKGTQYDYGWNVDGYPASAMYQEYFANNATNSIYAKLPSDLQSEIIDTTVVSGHGNTTGETNFTSTDKLYLLSTREVGFNVSYDTAYYNTRQLDYYLDVTTNDANTKRIKQYNGSPSEWWLRSASSLMTYHFFDVNTSGGSYFNGAHNSYGVAPAFRIG